MDRNSIIGLSLIFLILIGTIFINQPTVEELERRKAEIDSIARVKATQVEDSISRVESPVIAVEDSLSRALDSVKKDNQFGQFAAFTNGVENSVVIENANLKLTIHTKGGTPKSLLLKSYKRAARPGDTEKGELYLFENDDHFLSYQFMTKTGRRISTATLFFEANQPAVKLAENEDSASITLSLRIDEKTAISQVYTVYKESYEVGYRILTEGFDQLLAKNDNYLLMNWKLNLPLQEKTVKTEREKSAIYYGFVGGDVDNTSLTDYEKEDLKSSALRWISFKQQFFNSTLIMENAAGFSDVTVETKATNNDVHVKVMSAEVYIPHGMQAKESINMRFYFGPNHYQTLKQVGHGMHHLVPLGWGIFGWVNRFLVIPVFNFLNDYISSFGLIILVLTIIVKLLLLPLVYRSYISTAKMRVLKPEMDEIKAKFGDDPQRLQSENMKLFQKAGVSMFGGCVPMVLQMPILLSLFYFFPVSFELRQQPFLWADDLSTYDSIWDFGKVPIIDMIYGDHVSLFTLLMTISTLIYTRFNNQLTGVTGQMKYIGYIMPIFFLGFLNNYAAGLSYYYFLSNMITFGQQWIIRRFVDEDKLHAQIQENKKKPVKKSKFQERLENMAKQQQQVQRQQKGKK